MKYRKGKRIRINCPEDFRHGMCGVIIDVDDHVSDGYYIRLDDGSICTSIAKWIEQEIKYEWEDL